MKKLCPNEKTRKAPSCYAVSENLLKFSRNNRKLHDVAKALELPRSKVVGFDLPAGWTCPSAQDCKSKANRETGKITDGKDCKFRCYAVSAESAFTSARKMRWHNFDLLKDAKTTYRMTQLILVSLPENAEIVRIHTSGDFYNKAYFEAWQNVAVLRPDVIFYGYTKQAQYLEDANMPENMHIFVSEGGKNNAYAKNEPRVFVTFTKDNDGKIEIQNTRINVYNDVKSELHILSGNRENFALLVHGTQPKGFYKNLRTA
jgi:hypothetical protein